MSFYAAAMGSLIEWNFKMAHKAWRCKGRNNPEFEIASSPDNYPMSTVWLNGRMPESEWKEMHKGEYLALGDGEVKEPLTDRRD